ncbi:MAG TPA: prolipoprotein diacylglyceryl transferase family protein [Myxococcota bacterium]
MALSDLLVPDYALPVIAGILLAVLYPTSKQVRAPEVKRGYRTLLVVTFVFGVLGAKLVALMGDRLWPAVALEDGWRTVVFGSGRSIVGGVLFGHVASEIARPLIGYTAAPNDRLAVAVCFSVALGRVGCALAGCCRGVPWDGPFALTYDDAIPRFPTPLLELVFHVLLACVFLWMERKRILFGRLFSLYLVVYGVFRFATEPLRVTPKPLVGFSVYQLFCVALVVVGVVGLLVRTYSSTWRTRLTEVPA